MKHSLFKNGLQISMLFYLIIILVLAGCWGYANKQAVKTFNETKRPFSVTVYPTNVIKGDLTFNDSSLSSRVVFFLEEENLAYPVLGERNFSYPFKWGMNQAKMNSRSAKAFAEQVKHDNIRTDYALLPEILCNGNETAVLGASYYLVDKNGLIANGSLTNSDWDNFKKVNPKNRNGGIQLIMDMLRENWTK